MNKHLIIKNSLLLLVILSSLFIFLASTIASAQTTTAPTEYTLLAPLPLDGAGGGETTRVNPQTYLRGLFQLIIGLAGGLAVVMIIYGGVTYMSTDAFSGKESAKEIISNAIWGLLLAISSWLILYTINPALVNINLSIEPQQIQNTIPGGGGGTTSPGTPGGGGGGGTLPGYTLTAEQVAANNAVRQELFNHNPRILVNNGPCTTGGTSGCTNVVGLPQNAISGVMNLATNCQSSTGSNCNVIITGGTEGGHRTHGPNIPVVDLGMNMGLDTYIRSQGQRITPATVECSRLGAQYRLGGAIYVDEGNHWHVCY